MKKETEDKKIKAQNLWQWFEKENSKYLFLNEIQDEEEKEKYLDEFIIELHKYNENLYFEIGGRNEKLDLIITAEGLKEYFEDVEFLIAQAPELKNWNFIAFKPPMGTSFNLKYRDYNFNPNEIIFISLVNEETPNSVGIVVCYSDYNEYEKEVLLGGTYLILDVILGEKSTTLDIEYLDVQKTPDNLDDYAWSYLSELRQYIDKKKGKQ